MSFIMKISDIYDPAGELLHRFDLFLVALKIIWMHLKTFTGAFMIIDGMPWLFLHWKPILEDFWADILGTFMRYTKMEMAHPYHIAAVWRVYSHSFDSL